MDIRRLTTRGIANLAYAYLVTGHIEEAVANAEQVAAGRKQELNRDARRQVVEQALRDFNEDLERDPVYTLDADPERISRARDNMRALAGLMSDIQLANEADQT